MHYLHIVSGVIALASAVQAKDKTLIDPLFWAKLQRYTLFSAASETIGSGATACPKTPFFSTLVKTINVESTDTQATIFRDDLAREYIISFPGTASDRDDQTDYNETMTPYRSPGVFCPGCHAHGGFLEAWNSAAPEVESTLRSLLEEHPMYKVTPTGHSLGGAMALLCYTSLRGLKFPVDAVYTYGQPRVGDQKTANYIDWLAGASDTEVGQVRRVTHSIDGIPQAPTLEKGFHHTRTEFFEQDDSSGNQTASITYRCYGQDAMDCNRGVSQGFFNWAHGMYTGIALSNGAGCY